MKQEAILVEAREEIVEAKTKDKKMEETKVEPEEPKQTELTVTDLPGVGAATAEKLASVGFDNLMSIAVATPSELVNAAGVSEAVSRKIINAARDGMNMGFMSGEDVMKKREQVMRISTGASGFDAILGGGFETGCISECFGQYGSAKTQIAHQLCVTLQKQDPNAVAVYIDTENTFRPDRIIQFAKGAGLDPKKVLKNIKVAKAFNSDHQMLLAEKVNEIISSGENVRLVIVDSLIAHFRAEFVGRGTLAERQQKLNKHMHVLARLADTNNICVYVTNQVMSKPDQFFGDPTEAVGGHIVGHNSAFRIYLRRGKKGTRVAKLVDAPNLPDDEAIFQVTESAIVDA
ncbi:DNA repair and recombination protein RadA [Candidatus Woesearchaeota archaeon]|nr:DNA repair and recombination protein RadA [Candidatus Woesearchaeota archaeon]